MSLVIRSSGLLSLLQDFGRTGYRHIGVTCSGPMDEQAFLWANHLLGNNHNDAMLEICYGGFHGVFNENTQIAICGADLHGQLDNKPIVPWRTYKVQAGNEIFFSHPKKGLRVYLATSGGFMADGILGSVATSVREGLGGLLQNGTPIQKNNVLSYAPLSDMTQYQPVTVPDSFVPKYNTSINLAYVPNPQFGSIGLAQFNDTKYQISENIDRMGYRLQGKPLRSINKSIISQGVITGSIQIPKDGQPIVLMRDCQTIGGYPVIGSLTVKSCSLLANSLPNTTVKFYPVSIEEARAELKKRRLFFGVS